MYQLTVESHFDAAHALRGYQGKCENLHGHRFKVMVKIRAGQLDGIGLVYDFTQIKAELNLVLDRLDHTNLNETPPFTELNPSSENLAATIFQELASRFAGVPVVLSAVEVWESPECSAEYRPD